MNRAVERPTQYARTSDEVQIAYCTKGRGKPFVEMPPIPFSHGAGPAEIPEWQAWDEEIARRGMLVEYDCRGAGMSDRDVADFSLDGWIRDLEAVAAALRQEPFVLFAPDSLAVPVAIAYAARWPGRVSHLVLWQAHSNIRQLTSEPWFAAVVDLMAKDWVLFSEVLMQVWEGLSEPETAHREAAKIREIHTPHGLRAALDAGLQIDVSDLLRDVTTPTLVLHRRDGRQRLDEAMKVASGIPGARFALVEGTSNSWALQHPEAVLQAIDDFVGWSTEGGARPGTIILSRRELEVLRLLATGKSAREIGGDLTLAVRTVERHISNIYRKIGARNRGQAVALAIELGLTGGS
jgi:DNA-binding CsgD family transcriptional regulator/pimeloyl-ACP methyl ester carboxylesterase